MFDSTVVLLELTRSARCGASCACVILYAFTIMILGRWKGDLFSERAASDAVCLSSKLQPMVYAPSHTQSGYIYNRTVILANR